MTQCRDIDSLEVVGNLRLRHKKVLLGKVILLVVMLLVVVGGLSGFGCIKGLQPIGWSGGAVADGILFVGSEEGRLVAVNLADSTPRWSREELKTSGTGGGLGCMAPTAGGGCGTAPAGVAIYGTPVMAGDLVYVGGYNGKIYAFNASSLETRWVYPREGFLEPIVSGPAVALGRVYIGCSDGRLYAFDAATGDWHWEFEAEDKIWSTPAIEGDRLFVGSFDKKLYALSATDGKKQWEFETEGAIAATPLVYNNTVYIGSFDRYRYAVDAADGSLRWKFIGENWFWAKPVAHNGVIYAGNLDGKVYVLNAESGAKLAEFDLGSPVSSSPVVVNDSVIFASQQGVIYTLDIGSNQLRQLADIEEEVYGPLSASGGIIYIHTQDMTLHPIDASTGAKLPTISLKSSE